MHALDFTTFGLVDRKKWILKNKLTDWQTDNAKTKSVYLQMMDNKWSPLLLKFPVLEHDSWERKQLSTTSNGQSSQYNLYHYKNPSTVLWICELNIQPNTVNDSFSKQSSGILRGSVVKCLTRNPGALGSSHTESSGFFRRSVLGQDTSDPQPGTEWTWIMWTVSVIWLKYCWKRRKTPFKFKTKQSCVSINSLPNDKILDWPKLKAFVDNKKPGPWWSYIAHLSTKQ